jgi:putative ABC transport system substrate-binding protein
LLELVPKARRIALVGSKGDWDNPWGKGARNVAARRGVNVFFAEGNSTGFGAALEELRREMADAFFVALTPATFPFSSSFGEFTVAHRIPSSCAISEMADRGCLMTYGLSLVSFWTQAVTYVDKILKGAKPSDLPIEQPTKFELVINLTIANAIGLKVPQSLLLRADRVIE